MRLLKITKITKDYQGLPGITKDYHGLPGDYQGLPGITRDYHGITMGLPWDYREITLRLPEITKGIWELPILPQINADLWVWSELFQNILD